METATHALASARSQSLWRLSLVLFFASGLSSLIYQVLWMRLLVLVFGGTTLATSTVLAVFMGGLALGSFMASRFADRTPRPFFWYGVLEAVIGLWALIAPFFFGAATPIYQWGWNAFHASPVAINLIRFLVASVILLPPTTCMGATLPLLSRFVTEKLENIGKRVGTLYAINTFGAVVGTLVAGFVLLPNLGLQTTTLVAVAINLLLCAVVVLTAKKTDGMMRAAGQSAGATSPACDDRAEAMPPTAGDGTPAVACTARNQDKRLLAIMALFGIAGGASMVYEVAWTRCLLLIVGSSTYAFSAIVSCFLIGIVLGSWFCSSVIDKKRDALPWLAGLEIAAGVFALGSILLFGWLPFVSVVLGSTLPHTEIASAALRFLLAAIVLVPLTTCLGATFPAVAKACTTDLSFVGRSIGTLYSANTLGAIVGAFIAGFLMLPTLGIERSLVVAASVNIAVGVCLLCACTQIKREAKATLSIAFGITCLVFLAAPPRWDKLSLLATQPARRFSGASAPRDIDSFSKWLDDFHQRAQLVYYRDGISSNVAVVRDLLDGHVSLVTNGHVDASDGFDMTVQQMLGYVPLLLEREPQNVAVVGWGSGVTIGAAAQFPSVKHIDAIELEPSVLEAARSFDHVNHRPDVDKRVELQPNDGRNFLLASATKYDAILSEPSNPWQAGVCNLFTKEYFQICRQRLKDDGILAAWLQITEVDPLSAREIMSAVRSAFPHTLTFSPDHGNLIILASKSPLVIDPRRIQAMLEVPSIKSDLTKIGMGSAEQIMAHFVMADDGLNKLIEGAPANSDDRNRVEYEVARSYEVRSHRDENNNMIGQSRGHLENHLSGSFAQKIAECEAIGRTAASNGNLSLASYWYDTAVALAGSDQPELASTLAARGEFFAERGLSDAAKSDLQKALAIVPSNEIARCTLARLYAPKYLGVSYVAAELDSKRVLEILRNLPDNQSFCKQYPITLLTAAEALVAENKFAEARAYLYRYNELVPDSIAGTRLMSRVAAALHDRAEETLWADRFANAVGKAHAEQRLLTSAKQLAAAGYVSAAENQIHVALEYNPDNPTLKEFAAAIGHKFPSPKREPIVLYK